MHQLKGLQQSVTVEIMEGCVPASEVSGAFVNGSTAESEKTVAEEEELRSAGVEVMGWFADVEAWVEKSRGIPGVEEDDGATVEVSALKSRVKSGVGGVSGPVLVLGGEGPVEEVS